MRIPHLLLLSMFASAPALAAPQFSQCFTLTPGVSYSTGDAQISIERESFQGQNVVAVSTNRSGVMSKDLYSADGRALVATFSYGIAEWGGDSETPVLTTVFPGTPRFPADVAPGKTFRLEGDRTSTNRDADGNTYESTFDRFDEFRFVGFENLDLELSSGEQRTFQNTCHLQAISEDGDRVETWYAPGLGMIQFQRFSGTQPIYSDALEDIEQ